MKNIAARIGNGRRETSGGVGFAAVAHGVFSALQSVIQFVDKEFVSVGCGSISQHALETTKQKRTRQHTEFPQHSPAP